MGKGDKKTRKGKIAKGTYGVRRPKNGRPATPQAEEKSPSSKAKK